MPNMRIVIFGIVILLALGRAIFTGRVFLLRRGGGFIHRRSHPALFFLVIGIYLFAASVVALILSGHLMTVINMTI